MADKTMVDYTQKIKPYFEGIAPIEPTTTAASTHAVGDKFYLNGTKVKCTVAISVGDTIAIGVNVEEADDVESEIQTLTNLVGKKTTTQTLAAGSTSLTFTDSSITTASTIRCFVSKYGIAPTDIVVTTGQAVLTFDAQISAISVYLMII